MGNAVSNWWGTNVSTDPKLKAYNSALTPLSSELPRFYNGGKAPTIPDINQTRQDFGPNGGEAGLRSMIGGTMNKLQGRYGPIIQAYQTGMSSKADITQLLEHLGGPGVGAKLQALQNYAATGKLEPSSGGTSASPTAPTFKSQGSQQLWKMLHPGGQ